MGVLDFGTYKFDRANKMGLLPKDREPNRDELRLNYAIQSIQRRLLRQGFDPHRTDGVFGYYTGVATKQFQKDRDLRPLDGALGLTELRHLFTQFVFKRAAYYDVVPEYLWGLIFQESGFDPAAVGFLNPNDRGLMQINESSHPDVSDEEAFNAEYAINWGGERMHRAYKNFQFMPDGETPCEWAWDCTIAQHNSPADAQKWYETGVAPDEQIATYVSKVKDWYGTLMGTEGTSRY